MAFQDFFKGPPISKLCLLALYQVDTRHKCVEKNVSSGVSSQISLSFV